MSDPRHTELYSKLLAFVEEHGHTPVEGVVERGMPESRALEFIALLESHGVPLYGLEVWRLCPGGYDLDASSIWYCGTDLHHQYSEAREGLRLARPRPLDLVTVQFG